MAVSPGCYLYCWHCDIHHRLDGKVGVWVPHAPLRFYNRQIVEDSWWLNHLSKGQIVLIGGLCLSNCFQKGSFFSILLGQEKANRHPTELSTPQKHLPQFRAERRRIGQIFVKEVTSKGQKDARI